MPIGGQLYLTIYTLSAPSCVNESVDERRVRALMVSLLERGAQEGNSLEPASRLIRDIRNFDIRPQCLITNDIMSTIEPFFVSEICIEHSKSGKTYQLKRLYEMKEIISHFVNKRIAGARHAIEADWGRLIEETLVPCDRHDVEEIKAREEKAAALNELASSRFSVLVGPAGTGKTKLLSILCNQQFIKKGGILLLAPTGKARVKMSAETGEKAYTLAQFLLQSGRYDEETGNYFLARAPKFDQAKTVIVDEASMLTEEQLGALIDSLKSVERFILVGDYRQLPPIGVGRPFVDIVNHLKKLSGNVDGRFPRVARGYAELTVIRRQQAISQSQGNVASVMADLKLAKWFSGSQLMVDEDDVFDILVRCKNLDRICLVKWETPEDLLEKLTDKLVEELRLTHRGDVKNFALSLGATESNGYLYFNIGAEKKAECWQILTPVKPYGYGVKALNRFIQEKFRSDCIQLAEDYRKKTVPKPYGPDRIVYGDKVINVRNHRRNKVFPKDADALQYVANGEIGIVTGKFRRKYEKWSGTLPLNVTFSSQSGYSYVYYPVKEEEEAPLELAYALTVHKAQGSDFDLLFFILPARCPLLSRELLYTAFTRHRKRIVIMHQGDIRDLKKYSYDNFSDTYKRITNIFAPPDLLEIDNKFFERELIHRTSTGIFVRSKSELVIAELLTKHNIDYSYEKKLVGQDGAEKYPDFTIDDADTGITYYWEHLGMLTDERYLANWECKLAWYKNEDILPYEEGGGKRGILITSSDASDGSIDAKEISRIIQKVLKS